MVEEVQFVEVVDGEAVPGGGWRGDGVQLPGVRQTHADGVDVDALGMRCLCFRHGARAVDVRHAIWRHAQKLLSHLGNDFKRRTSKDRFKVLFVAKSAWFDLTFFIIHFDASDRAGSWWYN